MSRISRAIANVSGRPESWSIVVAMSAKARFIACQRSGMELRSVGSLHAVAKMDARRTLRQSVLPRSAYLLPTCQSPVWELAAELKVDLVAGEN